MKTTVKPDSSMIASYSYDPDTQELEVSFHRGKDYTYKEVPEALFLEMQQAESAGKFFLARIKGYF